MPARFVPIDHGTPMLLPPDLRDWVPEDGLRVPAEIARRRDRIEKLREATALIRARAKERHREEIQV